MNLKRVYKSKIILALLILRLSNTFAQDNPYEVFGHTSKVVYETKVSEYLMVKNSDNASLIKSIAFNIEEGLVLFLGDKDTILSSQIIQPEQLLRWLSVDPKSNDYPDMSPYNFVANNPVFYIDPDGRKFVNFDSDGNYKGTTKDNLWHNLWHGSKGRVIDNNGNVTQKFRFADPKNDAKDIQNGTITKLIFVTEKDISLMVARSGSFDHENKTENRSLTDRYSYINKEGKGGGKMDFSYTQIPKIYQDASSYPLDQPSPLIFLVNGTAHNQMNFGNFMFGASGQSQGFSITELKVGAHYNSVFNSRSNEYLPQLDSKDDLFSINEGFNYANQNNYDNKVFKVEAGDLSSGKVIPEKN
jgi:hypothetical protein